MMLENRGINVTGPRLHLEEIDTPVRYEINPEGLKTSERRPADGKVYAGSLAKDRHGAIINDIVMENSASTAEKHFMIKYDESL
jgi:hypothetical protein